MDPTLCRTPLGMVTYRCDATSSCRAHGHTLRLARCAHGSCGLFTAQAASVIRVNCPLARVTWGCGESTPPAVRFTSFDGPQQWGLTAHVSTLVCQIVLRHQCRTSWGGGGWEPSSPTFMNAQPLRVRSHDLLGVHQQIVHTRVRAPSPRNGPPGGATWCRLAVQSSFTPSPITCRRQ